MKKYEALTKYRKILKDNPYGEWVYDDVNPQSDKRPYVIYTDEVNSFVAEVNKLNVDHMAALENISKEKQGELTLDIILASLSAVVGSEKYSENKGMMLARLQDGTVDRLLHLLEVEDK